MIIENIQFAKLVDRAALVTEEIVAVHEYRKRTTDAVKCAIAHLHFLVLIERYNALVSGVREDRKQEFGDHIQHRLDEIQLQRGEELQRLREYQERQREELAMLGLIAA